MTKKHLKLICETDFYDMKVMIEQDNKNTEKTVRIRGPYAVAETENANKRKYLKSVLESAVKEFKDQFIDTKRSVGELNHPTTIDVDYNNACHLITSMEQDGNIWIGESKVLTHTPKGSLLAGLLVDGVKVGMSTRGVGNINENKEVDDYKLITVDVVHEPSGPGCFMEGILESRDFMINKFGEIVEIPYEELVENLMSLPKNSDAKSQKISQALKSFLKSI